MDRNPVWLPVPKTQALERRGGASFQGKPARAGEAVAQGGWRLQLEQYSLRWAEDTIGGPLGMGRLGHKIPFWVLILSLPGSGRSTPASLTLCLPLSQRGAFVPSLMCVFIHPPRSNGALAPCWTALGARSAKTGPVFKSFQSRTQTSQASNP